MHINILTGKSVCLYSLKKNIHSHNTLIQCETLRNTDTFINFSLLTKKRFGAISHTYCLQVNPTEKLQALKYKKKEREKSKPKLSFLKNTQQIEVDWIIYFPLWIQLIMLKSLITWNFCAIFCVCMFAFLVNDLF